MRNYINRSNLMSFCLLSPMLGLPNYTLPTCKNFVFTRPEELASALGMSTLFICEEMKRGALQYLGSGPEALIEIEGVKEYLSERFHSSSRDAERMLGLVLPWQSADYFDLFFESQKQQQFPILLSVNACSNYLHVKKRSIYRLLHNRAIPYFWFGNKYRIPKAYLLKCVPALGLDELTRLEELYQRGRIG